MAAPYTKPLWTRMCRQIHALSRESKNTDFNAVFFTCRYTRSEGGWTGYTSAYTHVTRCSTTMTTPSKNVLDKMAVPRQNHWETRMCRRMDCQQYHTCGSLSPFTRLQPREKDYWGRVGLPHLLSVPITYCTPSAFHTLGWGCLVSKLEPFDS